ncbi:hypothetical protein ABFS83_13G073900 [Erythranthe nasuta]
MAVEVLKSNMVIVDNGSAANESMDNEKVNIKFGSHGVEEPPKGETNSVSEPNNLPTDAVDEWPEPKQIHSFYIVRYRALEDHNLKAKLDLADKELQKKNQARFQIIEKLRAKRGDRGQVLAEIRSLSVENRQFRTIIDEKRKEMEPLQQALGKLRGNSLGGGREKGSGIICSSEAELNNLIKSLEYRIQHESIPLSEEKQIMREIKQLEGTRDKVIVFAAERAKIQDSMGEKVDIQGQVKSIGVDLDGVRKDKQVVNAKLKQLDEAKAAIEKEINALEEELNAVSEKRDSTFETIRSMRKQREEGNTPFYQNRMVLTKAKALASEKDVGALKEHSDTEVENFMSLWNSNKSFRVDYESRILQSLDQRQLSKDGRLRNPNEKPLLQPEAPPAAAAAPRNEVVAKQIPKEVAVAPTTEAVVVVDPTSEQKVEKAKGAKGGNKKTRVDEEEEEELFFVTKKDSPPAKTEVDEAKLKEIKREEEIAKRIQAEERKKKMAEKAAAKAAIKAEKEAEKKLKEREKKAKKKSGGGAVAAADSEEAAAEVAEPEKIEEEIEIPAATEKVKDRKGSSTVRPRARPRGQDTITKTILKRKKGTNYWVWAAPAATMVVLVLVVVAKSYL